MADGRQVYPWNQTIPGGATERLTPQYPWYGANIPKAKISPTTTFMMGGKKYTVPNPAYQLSSAAQDKLLPPTIPPTIPPTTTPKARMPEITSIGGYDYEVTYDENGNPYYEATGRLTADRLAAYNTGVPGTSPYQWAQLQQGQQQWGAEQAWQKQKYEQEMAWNQQQLQAQQAYQQQQLAAQKEEQLANLRANPASWLEYKLLANQTPAIQPWMMPLMPQQYMGRTTTTMREPDYREGMLTGSWEPIPTQTSYPGVQAGQPIPGWYNPSYVDWSLVANENPANVNTWSQAQIAGQRQRATVPSSITPQNMPALTPPSAQYLARMGPTSLGQYGGYERVRTGITPEELQFRLRSTAPPSGAWGGLTWGR